jgi:hypothetical protein
MKRNTYAILTIVAMMGLTGCGTMYDPTGISQIIEAGKVQDDSKAMQQRMKITTGFNNSPDTDAWYDQRQKLTLAMGERVFDKDFPRVYDSLVLAVSTLELKVNNMERQSGYIQASGITLPPTESKAIYREAVNEWCKQKGYDPSILDREYRSKTMRDQGEMLDFSGMMGKYEKMQKSLTFQLVKMGNTQTKVKVRFSDVYYPAEVEAYYKMVWQAVDKQIFIDQNIEGGVEKRTEASPLTPSVPAKTQ